MCRLSLFRVEINKIGGGDVQDLCEQVERLHCRISLASLKLLIVAIGDSPGGYLLLSESRCPDTRPLVGVGSSSLKYK